MRYLPKTMLCAASVAFASIAQGLTITIDPQDYQGEYTLAGERARGVQLFDLAPGTYRIDLGSSSNFDINLDTAGNVITSDSVIASGGVNTVTLNNVDINIDPVDYPGQYDIVGIQRMQGYQTITVVPGILYSVQVAASAERIQIAVDANGNVTTQQPQSSSTIANTLFFENTTVRIDPVNYVDAYDLVGVGQFSGEQDYVLVPGMSYQVRVGVKGKFWFFIDANGEVSSDRPTTAVGIGSTLEFLNVPVTVAANYYAGVYRISSIAAGSGDNTFVLLPDLAYGFSPTGRGRQYFDVDAAGNVSVSVPFASAFGNTLSLNTETVTITPYGVVGNYSIDANPGTSAPNPLTLDLVPYFPYRLSTTAGSEIFELFSPCAVVPNTLNIGAATLDIACDAGIADQDGDEIPDAADNCPTTPNTDQIDVDGDGQGDACDDDVDGDGVNNIADNCPLAANPNQQDLDGDGEGDICDADVDDDQVVDDTDNCPLIANTDQADNDLDSIGDVCDSDDDNDTIEDSSDNCPLIVNLSQEDFDGDGEGDICDGDTDGDGVVNEQDLCAATSFGFSVNDEGCTGIQFVELACDQNDFAIHGRYVSCVAHAANDAVDQELLSVEEKGRVVRKAAKSK